MNHKRIVPPENRKPPAMVRHAAILSALFVASMGVRQVLRAEMGYRAALFAIPSIPKAQLLIQNTIQGMPINTVVGGDRCYWAPMCTADFNPKITFHRTGDERWHIYPE